MLKEAGHNKAKVRECSNENKLNEENIIEWKEEGGETGIESKKEKKNKKKKKTIAEK